MRFEIDVTNKTIILTQEVNLNDLIKWMEATVGIQGWKIKNSPTINYTYPSIPIYGPGESGYKYTRDWEITCSDLKAELSNK